MSIATSDGQKTVKSLISSDSMKARFTEVLRDKAGGFLASLASQSASGGLAKVEPLSVVAAAFVAATLDLPINKELGYAWIVPYKGKAQFQMGYKGYIQLAMRSGQYKRMNAFTVNKEALEGYDVVGEPVILFDKLDPSKETVGYAFCFQLLNGFTKMTYWSKEKVIEHAKRFSQSYTSSSSPWRTDFDQMALKTVIAHGLKKWGPMSVEMISAGRHDQGVQVAVDGEVQYLDNITQQTPMSVEDLDAMLDGESQEVES